MYINTNNKSYTIEIFIAILLFVIFMSSCSKQKHDIIEPLDTPQLTSSEPISKSQDIGETPAVSNTIDLKGNHKKYGGILTLANRGNPPAGFDTLRTSSIALHHVAGSLFGPGNLVMRCRDNVYLVCPYLSKSWVSNQSFTEWTFNIRDGVYWHDGTLFSAEDAKFWLELAFFGYETEGKIRAPAYFKGELGQIEKLEVLSNNRLNIKFASRNPHFLEILANPRFKIAHPRHLMEPKLKNGELSVSPLDIGLIGLGPFKLDEYKPNSIVRVRQFDEYWEKSGQGDELPYLEGINYVIIQEPFAMDVAFRSGRIDGGARGQSHYLSSERKKGYVKDLGDNVFFARIEGGNFRLAFNTLKEGPWQDPIVRRAIALWINKREAIPIVLNGFGWTTPDLGPKDLPVQRHFTNWPKFDLGTTETKKHQAIQLMENAGYPDGFSMGHLCRSINPTPCEFLKDQLEDLGVELILNMADEGEWSRGRISLDYDSQQGRLTPSPIPEGTQSVYGRYINNPDSYAKHDDIEVDNLYTLLGNALTLDRRVELWREIEKYLFVDKTYIIPIAESINVIPYRSYVKGLAIPVEDAHTNTDFTTVWIDK